MNVILHIGSPKTGTSSIQRSLADSSRHLLKNGFLYPVLEGYVNHNYLLAPFRSFATRAMLQRFGTRERALETAERHWKVLANRAGHHPEHTLVLSAEGLFQLEDVDGFCARLRTEVPSIRDVEVVAYLRRPSSYFAARTQQSLRASSRINKPVRESFASALRAWKHHGELHVSEFYKPALREQDAVSDFWHRCFPAVAPRLPTGSMNENVSLSAEGMALLQRYRSCYHPDRDQVFLPLANALMRVIGQVEKSNARGIVFDRPRLHDDICDFIDYSTADNEELAGEFGFRFSELKTGRSAPKLKSAHHSRVEDVMKVDFDKLAGLRELLLEGRHLPFSPAWKVVSRLRQMDLD